MTIGERLEEARKRQGISIREAAEATKIRGDYLLAMEDNSMNIALPEIYRRGFLKNYARFLKIDPAKILTDYEARENGKAAQMHGAHAHGSHGTPPSASGHRNESATAAPPENRSSFGRMELPSAGGAEENPTPPEPQETRRREPPRAPSLSLQDNTLYLKIAAGVAAFAVLIVLVILLVGLLRGSDDNENPTTANTTNATTQAASTGNGEETTPRAPVSGPETLTFRIKENVTLIIEQVDPPERLYSGTVQAGEVVSIERTGPITVRFTNGTGFEIERADGQIIRPNSPSIGRIVVRQ
jgi:cytoskeletal protein RodZ